MRTVRCSSRQPWGVSAQEGVCLGMGVSAWGGCLPRDGECLLPTGCTPPPMDRILDTRLCKHYLSATSFADGKYQLYYVITSSFVVKAIGYPVLLCLFKYPGQNTPVVPAPLQAELFLCVYYSLVTLTRCEMSLSRVSIQFMVRTTLYFSLTAPRADYYHTLHDEPIVTLQCSHGSNPALLLCISLIQHPR